jgi:hypothetical protein
VRVGRKYEIEAPYEKLLGRNKIIGCFQYYCAILQADKSFGPDVNWYLEKCMPRRTRPHHLLVQKFRSANTPDGFVRREDLIDSLSNSRHASTARGKVSGYVNDIRIYDNGMLEGRKAAGSRWVFA